METLEAAVAAGVGAVQIRDKEATSRELLELTREVRRRIGQRALVIVNDRADIAAMAGADGVHLGQDDLPPREARKILGPEKILGISTHSVAQARAAWKAGADYIGFGPIFPTKTKGYEKGLGSKSIATMERTARGPVFLIGGITPPRLASLGPGHRVAVSSAILTARDPAHAVKKIIVFL